MYIVSIAMKSIFYCILFDMMKKEEEQIPCNIYHINFKHPKAVLIAKVSPCVLSTEKAEAVLSSNLLRISAHLFGAPLPCPSPCPLPGVFSLCPMDHLTVRTLWYFSRYFSHFSLPRNVLHCEGIEPHMFCFLSLILDSVACATVQWLSPT